MPSQRALPYVDPHVRRGWLFRLYARLTLTPVMGWLSRHLAWRLDPILMRLSGGRIGFGLGMPTALLETTGARTGTTRHNVVLYFHDGELVTIIPSKFGLPEHPAWFHNARANPEVTLGGQAFVAEVVEDEAERTRLWELADNVWPAYAVYRQRAAEVGRSIPILRLVPR